MVHRISPNAFPQIQVENLCPEAAVVTLIANKTLALDGVACALDLRDDLSTNPLYDFEEAVAGRLGCTSEDEEVSIMSFRSGSTYKTLRTAYDRKVLTPPGLLIAQFSAEQAAKEETTSVVAHYQLPSLKPGSTDNPTLRTTYIPNDGKLTKQTAVLKAYPSPFRKTPKGSTSSGVDWRSGFGTRQKRGHLGTM